MGERSKTPRAFLAVTAITVIAVAMVFLVYAVVLFSTTGGTVGVVSFASTNVYYSRSNSADPSNWTSTLINVGTRDPWYAELNMSGGVTGAVTVTWTLKNATNPSIATNTTHVTLTGIAQTIYASSDGGLTANTNWGNFTTTPGTYEIEVVITQP
jgi:hypothetical protein